MTGEFEALQVQLGDGRVLTGIVDPEPADTALVWCHGTPFPVVPWRPLLEESRARGLRAVAWARPGYATSSPQPGRRVIDFAADARHVLAAIGVTDAIAAGWSGGGPHALSLGAALPEQCRSVLTIASVAPAGQRDLDWTAGMGPENIDEFERARAGGSAFEDWIDQANAGVSEISAAELATSMAGLLSPVDAAALDALDMAAMLSASIRISGAGSSAGWRDDDLAFLRPWGFEGADIVPPVSVWQGSDDLMVPMSHGRWLAAHLPTARANLIEGEGHLSLLTRRLGEMLDQVVALSISS